MGREKSRDPGTGDGGPDVPQGVTGGLMHIGEVAARVGLSLRRHYDEMGLVVPSERSAGGFRLYGEHDIERLRLIKTIRPLDFPLDQVGELLTTIDAVQDDDGTDPDHTAHLLGRIAMFRAATDSRIAALRAQVTSLETLSRDLRSLGSRGRRHDAGQSR